MNGGRGFPGFGSENIWKGNRCGCPNIGTCCIVGVCMSSYADFVRNFIQRPKWYGNPNLNHCAACPWPPPYSIPSTNVG